MILNTKYLIEREVLSPPGDTILETIEEMEMTQAELSERMGRPKERINTLIKGKDALTYDTAIQLERVLGIPVNFWMNREAEYREALARIEEQEKLQNDLEWLDRFPLASMKKLGWIRNSRKVVDTLRELLIYFRVASVNDWEEIYMQEEKQVAFKISLKHTSHPGAVAAWLRQGEIQLEKLELPKYNEGSFRNALNTTIRKLAWRQTETFANDLQQIAGESGVAVVYTPSLKKATICGAARWVYDKPLIQLSDRYKKNDSFWFSFYHESAHILLHPKKSMFLEEVEGFSIDEEKENEANEFAERTLFPKRYLNKLITQSFILESLILQFAEQAQIHPGIIVGQLQHKGKLEKQFLNYLKVKVSLFD